MSNLSNSLKTITPTIIGLSDARHYLVGAYDSAKNFLPIGDHHSIAGFTSIVEAKNFLREHNFSSVILEFQSAYDEMCGTQSGGHYIEQIQL